MQRKLSRKEKCSNRRRKCILKVARLHRKVVRQREYFLHNLAIDLVKKYDLIAIEDLNIS